MGLDYSFLLFFKRQDPWHILEGLAEIAEQDLEEHTAIRYPDRILRLPFIPFAGTADKLPIPHDDPAPSWDFMTSLVFEPDDELLDYIVDHPRTNLHGDEKVPVGYIYLTVYNDLSQFSDAYDPDLILLRLSAATSNMSILFSFSLSMRTAFSRLLQEFEGAYGVIDRENDGNLFWWYGLETDEDIPDASMSPAQIGDYLGIPIPDHSKPVDDKEVFATLAAPDLTQSSGVIEWEPGQILLDTYEVKGLLGEGGMGRVYRVRHLGWNIDLAVKRPKAELFTNPKVKDDFFREAETWIDLWLHPNLTTCHYVRSIDALPALFAECVEGGSLEKWIENRKLYEGGEAQALECILDIAIQFAWGLGFAHNQGMVHQDIKPLNVLMTPDGVAKVTDFGLAKVRRPERMAGAVNVSPLVSGGFFTPAYCSPEQYQNRKLDHKTDIWSWGVSILEMFTGGVTWEIPGAYAADLLEQYLESGTPEIWLPAMPAELAGLLRRCFADDPSARPQDMDKIANFLESIYEEETGHPYPRPHPELIQTLADSLNNKALSFWDIDLQEKAINTWEEALRTDAHHQDAFYNLGLVRWRTGKVSDLELLDTLQELKNFHPDSGEPDYLLACVHLERGDGMAAQEVLNGIQEPDANREEILAARDLASSPAAGIRPLHTFEDPQKSMYCLHMSADGQVALSGYYGRMLKLWDVTTGKCLRSVKGEDHVVDSVYVSDDGRYAVSAGSKYVRLWDFQTGNNLKTMKEQIDEVRCVCLSSDNRQVLAGYEQGHFSSSESLRLWDVESGRCLRILVGHAETVTSVSLSEDGRLALSGSRDKSLKLWDVSSGECLRTMKGHEESVSSVRISSDGRLALSGSEDKTIRLWDAQTGTCIRIYNGHTNTVESVCFSPDMHYILSGSIDRTFKLWELDTGRCLHTFTGFGSSVNSVNVSSDGRIALTGSYDGVILSWQINLEMKTPTAPFRFSRIKSTSDLLSGSAVYSQAMQSAAQAMAEGRHADAARQVRLARAQPGWEHAGGALDLWRKLYTCLPHKTLKSAWESNSLEMHEGPVNSACLSRDGNLVLSGSDDGSICVWDFQRGRLYRLKGHLGGVTSVCFSMDEEHCLSAGRDGTIRMWEIENEKCLTVLKGHQGEVKSISLSSDGHFVLSGGADGTIRLWDYESGACLRTLSGHKNVVTSVCIIGVNTAISASLDGTLRLWDLSSGNSLYPIEGHKGGITSVNMSLDGRFALSGSQDKLVKLWKAHWHTVWSALWVLAEEGRLSEVEKEIGLKTFSGHTDSVQAVCLSPNGLFAFSGGLDGTLKVWDIRNGTCLATLEGHQAGISSVCLCADARYILTGSHDHTLKVWALDWELED